MKIRNIFFFAAALLFTAPLSAQRQEQILSGKDRLWKIWMDREAGWQNDSLVLPRYLDLKQLPIHPPTCGWESLYQDKGRSCTLPTTVEQQFGTDNRWTYHGVSWYWSTLRLSDAWKDKKIILHLEQFNHRIEVFVNEQLVGYDAVGMFPYECDITAAVKTGRDNRLAIRVTAAGGNRGWEDFMEVRWGKARVLPTKDFSGIGGQVRLTGVDPSYIEDVFIKNLQPALGNHIQVQTTFNNTTGTDQEGSYRIAIREKKTGTPCFEKDFRAVLQPGENILKRELTVPSAKPWSADSPNMYECTVTWNGAEDRDEYRQDFGFRVFEIKAVDGKHNFYLNGKRIRFRSAIDWGIYAFNGLFPTDEVAQRSIMAVKEVGHNSLNFHRRSGDTPLFVNADTLGVYLYEEPGSFHSGGQNYNIDLDPFMKEQMYERLRRMVRRDRNHPSLLIYSLVNEDMVWTSAREMGMRIIHGLDDSRLILNSSGGNRGRLNEENKQGIYHIPPYGKEILRNYLDFHTAMSEMQLMESDLVPQKETNHYSVADSAILYWGEVRCYAGTFNHPLLIEQGKGEKGYDRNLYVSQNEKLKRLYENCSFGAAVGSIYDLTRLAGKGQYYTDGRLGQVIMTNDHADGYAVNGWSPGPDMPDEWASAITDQNRNPNADGREMACWNRPLQIAIVRQNGKYHQVGDTVRSRVSLVNEGKIESGDYSLKLTVSDGAGTVRMTRTLPVRVEGGDTFAQTIESGFAFVPTREWTSGYLTIAGILSKDGKTVTDGKEQVLLRNRISQKQRLKGGNIFVTNWGAAATALSEAGIAPRQPGKATRGVILAGRGISDAELDRLLEKVKAGARLILQTDSLTGEQLYRKGLLSARIESWGGIQTPHWNGNGSSYIEEFTGDKAVPSGNVISTRSWESIGDPRGFYPFESPYKKHIYGLYVANTFRRNVRFPEEKNVLVTYGELSYGKGSILLNTSYWVDADNVFTDLLFYNMIRYYLHR